MADQNAQALNVLTSLMNLQKMQSDADSPFQPDPRQAEQIKYMNQISSLLRNARRVNEFRQRILKESGYDPSSSEGGFGRALTGVDVGPFASMIRMKQPPTGDSPETQAGPNMFGQLLSLVPNDKLQQALKNRSLFETEYQSGIGQALRESGGKQQTAFEAFAASLGLPSLKDDDPAFSTGMEQAFQRSVNEIKDAGRKLMNLGVPKEIADKIVQDRLNQMSGTSGYEYAPLDPKKQSVTPKMKSITPQDLKALEAL